jgi:hypothetical protein
MTAHTKFNVGLVGTMVAFAAVLALFAYQSHASVTSDQTTASNIFRSYDLAASTTVESTIATTTAATSTNITGYFNGSGILVDGSADVRGAKHVDLYFTRGNEFGGFNSGTTTFSVQATTDGTNWYYVNRLILATSTQTSSFGAANGVYGSDPAQVTAANLITIGAVAAGSAATSTWHAYIDPAILNYSKIRCITFSTATSSLAGNGAAECRAVVTY